jgi:hypothetical protein
MLDGVVHVWDASLPAPVSIEAGRRLSVLAESVPGALDSDRAAATGAISDDSSTDASGPSASPTSSAPSTSPAASSGPGGRRAQDSLFQVPSWKEFITDYQVSDVRRQF